MSAAGVICEFNPLHAGHAYLLRRMREAVGADGCVVCAMSGRFVQRGEPAMADPYLRATCALAGGADLVLELPFPWSAGSAEHFASAGVHILASLGVDILVFGSESGDAHLLGRAAEAVMAPDFGERYATLCRGGMGTAAAYTDTLRASLGEGLPTDFPSSNDFLGIAYLCALDKYRRATGWAPAPMTVHREGAGYREDTLAAEGYPSATALRRLIRDAACDPTALEAILADTMPDEALTALLTAVALDEAPVDGDRLLAFFHTYYRLQTFESVEGYAECGGGLAGQLLRCARDAATPGDFLASLRSRRYTDARLRRAMLFGALGVTDADLRTMPDHARLLAANERGRAYLKAWQKIHREDATFTGVRLFTVVTKPADAPAGRQCELGAKADALFTLCVPEPQAAGALMKKSPIIQ